MSALMFAEMGLPKRDVKGLTSALLRGPRNFQAPIATDLIARRFTEGRPVCFSKSAICRKSALPQPQMVLATSLTRTWSEDARAEQGSPLRQGEKVAAMPS